MTTLVDPAADGCTQFIPFPSQGLAEARRLGRAFVAAAHGGFIDARFELRAAVVAFVARRREAGEPPERVIVALKTALFTYGGLHGAPENGRETASVDTRRALYDQVFGWTVDAYYAVKCQPSMVSGLPHEILDIP